MVKITSFRGPYGYLSNFHNAYVSYNGITYKNNEAAFQAQKTLSREEQLRFSDMNASDAKHAGRRLVLRPDWEFVKVRIMKEIVYAKFSQNKDLKEKLLATDNVTLEEGNTWGDRFWGTVNGQGKNMLGKILMEVRSELQAQK